MRKVIFAINMTIDGCVDHTKGIADEEVHNYFTQLIQQSGPLVYGRITYQLMVPFWPDVAKNRSGPKFMNEFALAFDAAEKVVFSRTLQSVEDKNLRLVHTGLQEEILRLKQEQGKDILLGGVNLPSQLIELGLVDEYRFVVHPIIAGAGTRLMGGTDLLKRLELKLASSKIFKSGCIALRYVKQGGQ